jgi:hypothetical protein
LKFNGVLGKLAFVAEKVILHVGAKLVRSHKVSKGYASQGVSVVEGWARWDRGRIGRGSEGEGVICEVIYRGRGREQSHAT